jgi:hypothetical protein
MYGGAKDNLASFLTWRGGRRRRAWPSMGPPRRLKRRGGVSWRRQLEVSVGGVSWRRQLEASVGGVMFHIKSYRFIHGS